MSYKRGWFANQYLAVKTSSNNESNNEQTNKSQSLAKTEDSTSASTGNQAPLSSGVTNSDDQVNQSEPKSGTSAANSKVTVEDIDPNSVTADNQEQDTPAINSVATEGQADASDVNTEVQDDSKKTPGSITVTREVNQPKVEDTTTEALQPPAPGDPTSEMSQQELFVTDKVEHVIEISNKPISIRVDGLKDDIESESARLYVPSISQDVHLELNLENDNWIVKSGEKEVLTLAFKENTIQLTPNEGVASNQEDLGYSKLIFDFVAEGRSIKRVMLTFRAPQRGQQLLCDTSIKNSDFEKVIRRWQSPKRNEKIDIEVPTTSYKYFLRSNGVKVDFECKARTKKESTSSDLKPVFELDKIITPIFTLSPSITVIARNKQNLSVQLDWTLTHIEHSIAGNTEASEFRVLANAIGDKNLDKELRDKLMSNLRGVACEFEIGTYLVPANNDATGATYEQTGDNELIIFSSKAKPSEDN
jgi:hypothetical protein